MSTMSQFTFRIASPCSQKWESMSGTEQVRHCGACNKNVFNFKEMSDAQISKLMMETQGRVCARLYQRKDGTVLTKDCPVGLAALRRRLVAGAMTAGAMLVSLFTAAPRTAMAAERGETTLKDRAAQLEKKLRRTPVVGPVIEKLDPEINVVAGGMRPIEPPVVVKPPPPPPPRPQPEPVKLTKDTRPKFGLTVGR